MKRFYEAVLDRIPLRPLWYACIALLTVAAFLMVNDVLRGGAPVFGGQEVVEVHITPDALLRAISRVSVTRCPDNVTYMPIRLPQVGAKLESVTVGGRVIPFKSGDGIPEAAPNTYYAMPSLPEKAMREALVEVTWSIPLAGIRTQDGCFQFPLQGVIPVRSFAANVVIDEGAPYEFGGKFKDSRDYNMFWTKRDRYVDCSLGWCGITLNTLNALHRSPDKPVLDVPMNDAS